ncbi:MAG: tRNA (N(6)-L-threonylcarbamoyladenosine(37)-C(2))-methylthiotransferase MtaB [Bacilli bacterium]|nr:tRNA (N(6)-L-threonylcarbamoyladenosine(37)-C(2))-methylthiotransferase MtaB [Clostridium sp.]MDY2804138.1 tRNA (N(6)-L-threonylcarbamoyladenosine(37)-C(2))-methylthiotransferase MtaB [Bacilli bacterium]
MKVGICSLGCKVNIYESELVTNILKNNNYTVVDFDDKADIYIINTCSVTNESDKKSRKMINRAKKNNPAAIIIVMGCYSQVNSEDIDVDIVLGNRDKSKIVEIIEEYIKTKQKKKIIYDLTKVDFEKMEITNFDSHTRAFVKIQDGCNAFCSYCIIPYVRGRVRSKDPEDVIKEVTALVEKGYKEIVLTGIHTGRYGTDINTNLEELLNKLVNIPNIYRIRLSSIEINEITPGIKELLKENKVMAKHLHIPLQSGSNKILKLMNRRYNKEEFLSMVDNLRDIPDISLTTDLIVGFPNEGEEEFNETIDTLKKIGFTKIHTFPYSKRKGTPAAIMDNQVSPEEKKKRVHRILDLSNKYEHNFYESKIGKIYDGVVEIHSNGTTIVHTSNFIPVIINDIVEEGTIVDVKIEKVEDLKVYGRIV